MNRIALVLLTLVTLTPTLAHAQSDPGDVSRLFSHQAAVTQLGASSYRLPLSVDVLAFCRPDLSDVRLYGYGHEIPWMLDSATRLLTPETEQLSEMAAPILETLTHATEGPTRAPTVFHEAYEIAGPGDPPSRGAWDLVLGSTRDHFVADVHVVANSADGSEREIGHASAFRFASPLRERLRIPVSAPGLDHLRVEVRGHDGFLDPVMNWVATRRARAGEELVVPLEIVSRTHEAQHTVLTIARPEGVLPDALRFTTSTAAFLRSVHVGTFEQASDGAIWRVPGDSGAESLDVRIVAAREPTIVVRIDDEDSPALDALTASAVLSRPVLVYFSQAETLRFGGGRVRAPHYDLAALQGSWAVDHLLDGTDTPLDATLGPITESPGWTNEPALAFLHRPGIVVPAGEHAYIASLEVTAAREGASRFVLDADVLAAAREDHADLRVVDTEGRQWPYLVRAADPLHLPITLRAPSRDGAETRYDVVLPAARVTASEVHVDPDAPIVSRPLRIVGTDRRGDETELASTSLTRYVGAVAGPLTLPISSARVSALWLEVTDGSETPLAFRAAELVIPTSEIVLIAPPGSYRVLVGDDDAEAPTYEIEIARGLLDTIPLDDATLGALAPNPAHHAPTFYERAGASTIALWVVLVVAILVLGVLTWRASRAPDPAPPVVPSPPPVNDEPPAS